MTKPFRTELPPHLVVRLRRLPPELKKSVRAALRALARNPGLGHPLTGELDGLWRYRVRRYRIVYEIDRRRRVLRILAVAHRRDVYEQFRRD